MASLLWNLRTNETVSPADLHVHSVFSDGLKTPPQLCAIAARLGIRWIALCDHDTMDGLEAMAQAVDEENRARGGQALTLIPSVEVSTGPGGRTHLLAYGARPDHAQLRAFLGRVCADRGERAAKMIRRLEELGMRITPQMRALPAIPSVGRAHIARALVEAGEAGSVRQAFERYLAEGKPAYVPRKRLDTGETVAALSGMGLVTVLAHPMRLGLDEAALRALILEWKAHGLRGIEAYHPSASHGDARMLDALARAQGLLVTGGSDYHGDTDVRARMGRLPAGWLTAEEDVRVLMSAVARTRLKAADDLQKEQQDV